jgi:hypothetical protein
MTPRLCWQNGPFTEGSTTSCILDHGHEGDHEWTRDVLITIETRKPEMAEDQVEVAR